MAIEVPQVFLEPPKRPRAILAEPEDVLADVVGLFAEAVRLGEQVGVDQAEEVGEAVLVAVVGRRRQQQDVVGVCRQALGQLVTLRFSYLSARPDCALV